MIGIDILVIDDDEDDFLIIRSLLEEISHAPLSLEWAASFREGEAVLAENRHSICLMDYRLGAHTGISLLKKAPELGFTGPIILLTGLNEVEIDMIALEAGAVDYLVKDGLTAQGLARSIRYALGRREMEHERIERLRAEADSRAKSQFLAHLSHELRTPLSAILGFTELLLNASQDAESVSKLNIVHRNGKHLLGLLNDILDLSKIEAGKLELEIQPVQLMPLLTDIYALMQANAQDKNLTLTIQAHCPLPEVVYTDPTRLRQVLLNIIGNAIKFTETGRIDIFVNEANHKGSSQLEFSIIDTGVGIDQEVIENIFHPFVQAGNHLRSPVPGTGLGLTISKQLVERLGGKLKVRSTPDLGSTFTFTIDPGGIHNIKRSEFSLSFTPESPSRPPPERLAGRVLVVDDLRDMRVLIGHFIKTCGPEVDYAGDGKEALTLIQSQLNHRQPYDLIFMDIHMPVLNGLEATPLIRQAGYTGPLVALTAAHMKGDTERFLDAGFNYCLSKPIYYEQIRSCLKKFLPEQTRTDDPELQPGGSTRSILVVEDFIDTLNATCEILELLEWSPLKASTGEEALTIMLRHKPDVALLDLRLPDMSGFELASKVLKKAPDIQIIFASGDPVDKQKLKEFSAYAIQKPISLATLKGYLDNCLSNGQ